MALFTGGSTTGGASGGGRRMLAEQGPLTLKQRFGALRHLPRLFRLVWATSPAMTAGDLALRLVRAMLPVAMLWVGKLVVDEVVRLSGAPAPGDSLADWFASGSLDRVAVLLL